MHDVIWLDRRTRRSQDVTWRDRRTRRHHGAAEIPSPFDQKESSQAADKDDQTNQETSAKWTEILDGGEQAVGVGRTCAVTGIEQ